MAKLQKSNDSVVIALKKQVEEKKAALKASEAFRPKTNCSLELGGDRVNIRTESKEGLVALLVALNVQRMSAEDLGLLDEFKLSGFPVQDWIEDVKSRLMSVNRKQEEDRLKVLEAKLHNLLSVDKKVELEIDAIKAQI